MKSPPLEDIGDGNIYGNFESINNILSPSILSTSALGSFAIGDGALENVQLMTNSCDPFASGVLQNISSPIGCLPNQTNFSHTFLKSILTSIDSKDPVVANAWLETLLDVIDLLPKEVVKDEILGLAINKGQSQQITSRLSACKLIGKISTKFEPYVLKNEILGVVQHLCQDENSEVRGSICSQLAAVARGVGLETAQSSVLPELVELCSDDEVNVRLAAINTVVQFIPLVDQETRISVLVPLVKQICEQALKVQDVCLPITAHLLGRMCHGLHDDLTDDLKEWFIQFFCTLGTLGMTNTKKTSSNMTSFGEMRGSDYEAECRHQCAYNMPAMVIFAGGASTYRKYLHDTLVSLVTDPSLAVCRTIALSFHQLCSLIGNEVGALRESFLGLLRSDNVDVISAIVPNISHILATFHHHHALNQALMPTDQTDVLELVGALKQAEDTVSGSNNWRAHSEVLRQIAALALCLPPDLLFSEVVPLMIARMHTVRPIPCRLAAARTLLVYLRHMESLDQRDHICNTLVIEFCEGKSCHKRMLFLNVCKTALDLLPKSLFKDHFYEPMLSLHVDPVPNIRLNVVNLLPLLKSTLVLPEDNSKLQLLESVVGNLLLNETDRDVSIAISKVINCLDQIEIWENEERSSPEGQEFDHQSSSLSQTIHDGQTQGQPPVLQLPSRNVVSCTSRSKSKMPSYVAAERRKSRNFAPEAPPDEKSVLRGLKNLKESFKDVDLSVLCDELLLSPEEPPEIDWDNIENQSSPSSSKESESKMSFLPALERLFIRNLDSRGQGKFFEAKEKCLEVLNLQDDSDKKDSGRKNSAERKKNNRSKKTQVVANEEETNFSADNQFQTNNGAQKEDETDISELTPRERFWLRTSRSRWRRKVASADTSPEEPRRTRISRGSSMDDKVRFSMSNPSEEFQNNQVNYVNYGASSLSPKKAEKEKPQNFLVPDSNQEVETNEYGPTPPSPNGMYTWPPQHSRHKHHIPYEGDEPEYQNKPSEPLLNDTYFEQLRSSYAAPQSQQDTNYSQFRNVSPQSSQSNLGQRRMKPNPLANMKGSSMSKLFEAEPRASSKLRQRPYLSRKTSHKSLDFSDSDHNMSRGLENQSTSSSYTNISAIFRKNSLPSRNLQQDKFTYADNHQKRFLQNQNNTLSLLLSATPKASGKNRKLLRRQPSYEDRISSSLNHEEFEEEEEDLYAVHNIPRTKARREPQEIQMPTSRSYSASFPQEMSEEFYPSNYQYFDSSNPDINKEPGQFPASSHKTDSSYKEIRYHLAAAAAAAEQEWIESKRINEHRNVDNRGTEMKSYRVSPELSPSYVVMDSGEYSPWSPSSAYPIGPLGASWIQRGFHTLNPPPYIVSPHLYRNRSLPPYSFPSHLSPPWHPSHYSSFHSLSTLDPSTDEFLVDAGIRFDEASLRSRIPAPSNEAPAAVRGSRFKHPIVKQHSQSRIRPPSVTSKIPIVGRGNEVPITTKSVVKPRVRVPQRQNRPISGISQQPLSSDSGAIGSSRGKSLSHENLRSSSTRHVLTSNSSSAKTSPVSSRPSSPNDAHHLRSAASSSRMRHVHQISRARPRSSKPNSCSSSPSGSRCASPDESNRSRRGGISTNSSPATSRPSSPGGREEEPTRNQRQNHANNQLSSRNRPNSGIPTMVSNQKKSSKLPLPTSKK